MRLYAYYRSSASYRVRIALQHKNIPYEVETVSIVEGTNRGEAHLARNPIGQVPVLEFERDGKKVHLAQSVAILEYLEETHPSPSLLPKEPIARARVRELVELVNSGIQPLQNTPVLAELRTLGAALFALFAGTYYWLPKWTGHMYSEGLGKLHFWCSIIFFNITFFPMHFLGLAGMPRRIPDYALQFTDFNALASVGAFGFGFSQLIFLVAVLQCVKGGPKAAASPWEGAEGLEWTVPSPAPYHTFEEAPIVK